MNESYFYVTIYDTVDHIKISVLIDRLKLAECLWILL